ncbi:unnamed protein product [Clonostachys rosea]|uniref:C2H2-type domain-containing protein n=1 Tax=Bionectria ochroleuca TaxID=29856 RepID=A0ABY6TRB1_BIOOC|nr:unnamed protein product [Clonostachys rosea]
MLIATTFSLFDFLCAPGPCGLVDVTFSLYQLLATLVAVVLFWALKSWKIHFQVCDLIGVRRRMFQYFFLKKVYWKKTNGEKIHDVTPKSSSAPTTSPFLFCILELKGCPTWIVLAVQCSSSRVQYWVSEAIIQHTGKQTAPRPTNGAGRVQKTRGSTGGRTNRAKRGEKLPARGGKSGGGGGGGGGKHPRKGGKSRFNLPDGPTIRSFACPFHKYDRVRYHSCATVTLTRIPDVWQHILRTHVLSLNGYCSRCFADFDSSSQLAEHRLRQNCVPILGPEHLYQQDVDYLDPILRLPSGLPNDAAKWYRIFAHVFPGWAFPITPYAEDPLELALNLINFARAPPLVRFARGVQDYPHVANHPNDPSLTTLQPEMVDQEAYTQGMNQYAANQLGINDPEPQAANIGPGVLDQEPAFLNYQLVGNEFATNVHDSETEDLDEEEG